MIKFETNRENVKCAMFGGNLDDVLAELCLEISILYGGIASQSKKAAKEFKTKLVMSMIDSDISDTIFSTDVIEALKGSGYHICGSVSLGDSEEILKQLKEILNESE